MENSMSKLISGVRMSVSIQGPGISEKEKRIPFCCFNWPAIYLYSEQEEAVTLKLNFKGKGFMTKSVPPYNDGWRVKIDPKAPFNKLSLQYPSFQERPTAFLDYDGIREGIWQEREGWQIEKEDFQSWLSEFVPTINLEKNEEEDFLYHVSRIIAELEYRDKYQEKYYSIFPQLTDAINSSVELDMQPVPCTVWRLWLYIRLTDEILSLDTPSVFAPDRNGLTLIELGILTDY